ncbi:MAG TPA: cyclophilin-like fold protein [Burkholderiales bacterium]
MKLRLAFPQGELLAELGDSPAARALAEAAPFESRAQTWGEEVYFTTPVSLPRDKDARQVVEPGSVCFWPEGDALALPFGRTPISTDERPKLASPCNVLGRLDDYSLLRKVRAGDKVRVEKA